MYKGLGVGTVCRADVDTGNRPDHHNAEGKDGDAEKRPNSELNHGLLGKEIRQICELECSYVSDVAFSDLVAGKPSIFVDNV